MPGIGTFKVSKNGLTESLCDGLTKRLFSELESYTTMHMVDCGVSTQFRCIDDLLNTEMPFIQKSQYGAQLTKKQAMHRLISLFTSSVYVDVDAFDINPLPKKINSIPDVLPGLTVENGRLLIKVLHTDIKKPTRSEVTTNGITFSKHAVSRIIYRFKPMFLSLDLLFLTDCINALIQNALPVDDYEYWVPIENVGSLLLRRDEVQHGLFHVVTFVDYDKLTVEQKAEGQSALVTLQTNNSAQKINFDSAVSQMLQHRAESVMNIPKCFLDI